MSIDKLKAEIVNLIASKREGDLNKNIIKIKVIYFMILYVWLIIELIEMYTLYLE